MCGVEVGDQAIHDAWHIGERRHAADLGELLDHVVDGLELLRKVQEVDASILDAHIAEVGSWPT